MLTIAPIFAFFMGIGLLLAGLIFSGIVFPLLRPYLERRAAGKPFRQKALKVVAIMFQVITVLCILMFFALFFAA